MHYCPSCKTIGYGDNCKLCGGPVSEPKETDWVLLAEDVELELNALCADFSKEDIAFEQKTKGVSAGNLLSRGFLTDSKIYVQYKDYHRAKQIAVAHGFHFPDDVKVTLITEDTTGTKNNERQEYSQVAGQKRPNAPEDTRSPAKKKIGKIILFGSIILAIIAVVIASDFIINLIKGAL